jgi:beta-1,4-mannosyl-glycoprotein beta-1,4-N-acetylglucosaminyltransferase
MASFSHQGWNSAENRDPGTLVPRVRGGKNLFGRIDQRYTRVDANADVPSYITQQNQREGKFGYLLNRDGESAGCEDYTTADSIGGSKRH